MLSIDGNDNPVRHSDNAWQKLVIQSDKILENTYRKPCPACAGDTLSTTYEKKL